MLCSNIRNEYSITHETIKETVKYMDQRQIKEKTKIWIENLVDELEQSSILDLISLKLETKIEDSSDDQDISPRSKSSLYLDLINLRHFPHLKGRKFYKKSNTRAEKINRKTSKRPIRNQKLSKNIEIILSETNQRMRRIGPWRKKYKPQRSW